MNLDLEVPDNSLAAPKELRDTIKACHTFLEDTLDEQINDRYQMAKSKIPKGPDGRPFEWSRSLRKYVQSVSSISPEEAGSFKGI